MNFILCVIIIMFMFVVVNFKIIFKIFLIILGFKEVVILLKSMIFGCMYKERMIVICCFCLLFNFLG